jgi:putative membrane protein
VTAEAPALRRLSPLTPLFNSWRMVGLASALGIGAFRDDIQKLKWIWQALKGEADLGVAVKAFLILVALVTVSTAIGWLSWRVTGFAIVEDPGEQSAATLLFHRGLLVRRRSQVRLKRVQAVDVNQPLIPRLFGLAAVRLDMAAGQEASANLAYLRAQDAWQLREEILRHTALTGTRSTTSDSDIAPRPERLVAEISTPTLVKASLLDGAWVWLLLVLWLMSLVVVPLLLGWRAMGGALAAFLPLMIAIVVQVRQQVLAILRDSNFTLTRTPTGIRISSGLTSTVNRTIEFDRIQGVRVEEPYLWRRLGWARVAVDVAGATQVGHAASLMPVADRPVALALVADVTGAWLGDQPLVPASNRARRLDPLAFPVMGVTLVASGALVRDGRIRRTTSYVPYARVQSVSVSQGWLQRRFGLATVYLDLPVGARRWVARHRDTDDAARMVDALVLRARANRRTTPASPSDQPWSGEPEQSDERS